MTLSNDFAARTALEDQYGFTIVEDQPVKVITDVDGITYYTIAIERDVKEELKFENLVIKVDSTDVGATILKYELDTKAVYNYEHDSYDIDIKETSAEELEVDGVLIQRQYINIWYWYSHCTVSPDHPNYCGGNPQSVYWTPACSHSEVVTIVIDNGLGGNSGGGGGTPSGEDGGSSGGGGAVGGSTTTPETTTNHNGETTTPITDQTPPIKTVIIPSEEVVEPANNPCNELKDLLKPLKGNINTTLNNVSNSAFVPGDNFKGEKGASFTFDGTTYSNNILPASTAYSGDTFSIPIPTGPNIYGAIHTHPVAFGAAPIFSFPDLIVLLNLYRNTSAINKSKVVYMVMIPDGTTYALKIDDATKFSQFVNSYAMYDKRVLKETTVKGKNNQRDKIFDKNCANNARLGTDNFESKYLRGFLEEINGKGVSLYQKTNATPVNGWKKLDVPDNPSDPLLKETPCNP